MKFIAIDTENNQPSGTVIQIGAVAIDTDEPEPIGKISVWIKPKDEPVQWDHKLQNGQTLGELLPGDAKTYLASGMNPDDGFKCFWDWTKQVQCGIKILQWGHGDYQRIELDSLAVGVLPPKAFRTLDFKQVYSMLLAPAYGLHGLGGLSKALKAVGLPQEGVPHDAYWDAYNLSQLARWFYSRIQKAHEIEEMFR